ncbi:MAG TPA: alpha/beta hydrolase [Caulobacteraceae bacterium]|jgi:lysophospholipase|nr:alpha/beta hydrolase [Caulobacteraceae bacterium]
MLDAAPIRSHPEVAEPTGGSAEWIEAAGGHRQRAALYPAADPVGTVVLSSGRTEFIEKYFEVIGELLARNYTVLIHDWRGQGLSTRLLPDALKGHADRFHDLVADFGRLLDHYQDRLPKPWISLSHSMGGCLTMLALARGERRFDAAIQSAPMLGLKPQRQPILRAVAWLMAGLAPNGYALGGPGDPFTATFEADRLTHDRARYGRTHMLISEHRDLALGGVTWGWVESAFEAVGWLQRTRALAGVSIPVTLIGAGQDNLVDIRGQERVASRLPHCRQLVIGEAFHEILMETDDIRAVFWREFDALAASIPAGSTSPNA